MITYLHRQSRGKSKLKKNFFILILLIASIGQAKEKKAAAKIGDNEGASAAHQALNEMLRTYESGNTVNLQSYFDSSMIGYQKLIDGISVEANNCKQMRINLSNTKTQVGPDLAVIQTNWEKRCLLLPNFKPVVESGQSNFLMHKNLNGWKMTGISGANPLTPVNLPATLKASTSTSCSAVNIISTPVTMSFSITVTDPYKTKVNNVNVKVSSGTDSETISLPAVAGQAGVFQTSTMLIGKGAGTSGNGAVEIVVTGGRCAGVNVSYVSSSASNGVQSLQTLVLFP